MEQKSEPLQNKKIILIGGSAGIGFAVAQAVAAKQAQVVIVSSNQERINKALETLPKNSALDTPSTSPMKPRFSNCLKPSERLITSYTPPVKIWCLAMSAIPT
jgi:NADPH:quinone reductase-like Zn-dependent oxidoreductase